MALVGVDARKWRDYGIGSYLAGLVPELLRLDEGHRYLLIASPRDRNRLPAGARVTVAELSDAPYSPLGLARAGRLARRGGVDLFHAPHYTLPFALASPAVVTVHDLIHLTHARSPWKALYARAMLRRALGAARRIIVPSDATARELRARFPRAAPRLRVVPNGLGPAFLREDVDRQHDRMPPDLPADYLLFVGNERPYKNLSGALEAFARVSARHELPLVLAGLPRPPSRALAATVARLGLAGRVRFAPRLEDELMPALYRGARLLLAPSLAEGFGLPALEAMSVGTPAVVSRGGAQEEVTAGAALAVDASDPGVIAAAAERLLDDAELRARLAALGRERSRLYRWSAAARTTLDIYREVLEEAGASSHRGVSE